MSEININDYQKELVERLGVFNEKSGMQPVAARILALLTVADKAELSFEEIQNTLSISKSSTSSSINMLLTINRIEYITKPGERKRYFRSKILGWKEDMRNKIKEMTNMNELLKEVLSQRPQDTVEFNNTLAEITDFLDFFHKEAPLIFKKWEEKNREKT